MRGKIKKYLSYRGFGFIEAEGKENDIFFHVSNYPRTSLPTAGQEIEFTLTETPKGEEATGIQTIEKTADVFNTEKTGEELEAPAKPKVEVEEIEDLDKLPGIGPKYQELLRAASIKSIDKLAKEDPEELLDKLNTANMEKEITKRPPNLDNVAAWINLAKN